MKPPAASGVRGPKRRVLWGGALAASLLMTGAALRPRGPGDDEADSRSVVPYRLRRGAPCGPDLETEIRLTRERLHQFPQAALDRAILSGLYVTKARTHGPRWYDEAEKTAQASLLTLPHFNERAKLTLAEVAQARHDFRRAIALAEDVLREKPDSLGARMLLSKCLVAVGKPREAARHADEAADRLPTLGSLLERALVLEALGKERESIFEFCRAIRMEEPGGLEDSSRARMLLGRLHLRHGRLGPAEELLEAALHLDPANHQAHGYLGDLALRNSRHAEAKRRYGQAFQISGEPSYLVRKARSMAAAGHARDAEALAGEAERMLRGELSRSPFGHRRTLAEFLLERGGPEDSAEALLLLKDEVRIRRDSGTLGLYADALLKAGRSDEARLVLREALRDGAEDAQLYLRASRIEEALGHGSRARFYRARAFRLDPALR